MNSELESSLSLKTKASVSVCILLILSLLLSIDFPPTESGKRSKPNDRKHIQICNSWGEQLGDGILTYRIDEGDNSISESVRNVVNQWDTMIDGLSLQEVKGESYSVHISIDFKKDGRSGRSPLNSFPNPS